MPLVWSWAALVVVTFPLLAVLLYTVWVWYRYVPTVVRIFEETPILRPASEPADPEAEQVWLQTRDGVRLCGSWLAARPGPARGTIVFCHEFLSDRWSYRLYCDPLRSHGFAVFTFDFRGHGESGTPAGYRPQQWVSEAEVLDVRAAIEHVATRCGGRSPIGLFGVSRGGSAAIVAAAREPAVAAVASDGAFPTHSTQLAYMLRWVGIYVRHARIYQLTPAWYYAFVAWLARRRAARRHGCSFPSVEKAIGQLSPRPLLMIHGEEDSYIVSEIARQLFNCARSPKELWMVPGAKHNAAVMVAAEAYSRRLGDFFAGVWPIPPQGSR